MQIDTEVVKCFSRSAVGKFVDVFIELPNIHGIDVDLLPDKILRRLLDVHQFFFEHLDLRRAFDIVCLKFCDLAFFKFPNDPYRFIEKLIK